MDKPESKKPVTPPSASAKAPYTAPTLRRYGPIRDLTAGGLGSGAETGNKASMKRN